MSSTPLNAIEVLAALERDAFACAAYVSRFQFGLNVLAGLLAACGFGLLSVSLAVLLGSDLIKASAFQVTVSLTALLWAPLAILMTRLVKRPGARNPEREFRTFLDQLPDTASRPVVWGGKTNMVLAGMDEELRRIAGNPGLRQHIIVSFGLRRLNLGLPLMAVGLALAGVSTYCSAVVGAGLSATLQLLILPAVAVVVLGLVCLLVSSPGQKHQEVEE